MVFKVVFYIYYFKVVSATRYGRYWDTNLLEIRWCRPC